MGRPLNHNALLELVSAENGALTRVWQAAHVLFGPDLAQPFWDALTIDVFAIIGGKLAHFSQKRDVEPDFARIVLMDHAVGGRVGRAQMWVQREYTPADLTVKDAYLVACSTKSRGFSIFPNLPRTDHSGRPIAYSAGRFWFEPPGAEVLFIVTVSGLDPRNRNTHALYQQLALTVMAGIQSDLVAAFDIVIT